MQKIPHGIHALYRNQFFEAMLFGYITALSISGNHTEIGACKAFQEHLNLNEDTAPARTLLDKFVRIRRQYFEAMREDRDNITFREQQHGQLIELIEQIISDMPGKAPI